MNTPGSVTLPAGGYARFAGREAAQRRTTRLRASPQTLTPRGRMRTKAVGAWSGSGLASTRAA
jgi:hypothetical protein